MPDFSRTSWEPSAFSNQGFAKQINSLVDSIESQEGAHLPGSKGKRNRLETETRGVVVTDDLLVRIRTFIGT